MKMIVIFQMKNYDKLTKAETMLSKGIEWFEVYEVINTTRIFLFKVQNIAAQKARTSKQQKKITDSFKI